MSQTVQSTWNNVGKGTSLGINQQQLGSVGSSWNEVVGINNNNLVCQAGWGIHSCWVKLAIPPCHCWGWEGWGQPGKGRFRGHSQARGLGNQHVKGEGSQAGWGSTITPTMHWAAWGMGLTVTHLFNATSLAGWNNNKFLSGGGGWGNPTNNNVSPTTTPPPHWELPPPNNNGVRGGGCGWSMGAGGEVGNNKFMPTTTIIQQRLGNLSVMLGSQAGKSRKAMPG